jgi:hypothetical protein
MTEDLDRRISKHNKALNQNRLEEELTGKLYIMKSLKKKSNEKIKMYQ